MVLHLYSGLTEQLFMKECEKHYENIEVIEKILKATPSMKDVGINYYY
ncbi:MAG: hypothetical protein IJF33_01135 [Clostridia bacterium]|nr:hypothetical protein [Clostridia bacterium]